MVIMGDYSYGDINCKGQMNDVIIGKFVQIADNVTFDCGINHNSANISTYPFHIWLEPNRWPNNTTTRGNIVIGNDVWIGMDSLIMSGVTIGDGAIIGARSVITKDVQAYSVVVGANRWVKDRFNTVERVLLEQMQWWNWNTEQIENVVPLLHSGEIDELYKYYLLEVKK